MKIIVDSGRKKELRKINDEILLCVLPYKFTFAAKFLFIKFIRSLPSPQSLMFYHTETLSPKILKKLSETTDFKNERITDIFLSQAGNILKTLNTGTKMRVCIFSDTADERIFCLCDRVNPFCDMLYIVTQDENFYEKISDYTLEKYGLAITLRQFSKINTADVNIILNSSETNFSYKSGYTINLSENEICANKLLSDIIPLNNGDFSGIEIKKCLFLTEKTENFNLIWKNSQKSVDKFKK